MRDLIADTFAAAGAKMGDHVSLAAVDPMYRACFSVTARPSSCATVGRR